MATGHGISHSTECHFMFDPQRVWDCWDFMTAWHLYLTHRPWHGEMQADGSRDGRWSLCYYYRWSWKKRPAFVNVVCCLDNLFCFYWGNTVKLVLFNTVRFLSSENVKMGSIFHKKKKFLRKEDILFLSLIIRRNAKLYWSVSFFYLNI